MCSVVVPIPYFTSLFFPLEKRTYSVSLEVTRQQLSSYGDLILYKGGLSYPGLTLVVKAVYIASVAGLVASLQRFTMGTLVSFLFLVFSLRLKCLFPMLWCFDALHVHCQSLKQCDPLSMLLLLFFFFFLF